MNETRPKVTLRTEPNPYGFGYDWSLVVELPGEVKHFWLGQDAKYCSRVLGMSGSQLAYEALGVFGPFDMTDEGNVQKLADFLLARILDTYQGEGDPVEALRELDPWTFSCQ